MDNRDQAGSPDGDVGRHLRTVKTLRGSRFHRLSFVRDRGVRAVGFFVMNLVKWCYASEMVHFASRAWYKTLQARQACRRDIVDVRKGLQTTSQVQRAL